MDHVSLKDLTVIMLATNTHQQRYVSNNKNSTKYIILTLCFYVP